MISRDREYRNFDYKVVETEDTTKQEIEGTPLLFDKPTKLVTIDGVDFFEVIEAGALDNTDLTDVVLVIDHTGKPAAKTKNNTLKVEKTEEGLYIQADLSKNATGRELYEDIQNGFYEHMSFCMIDVKKRFDRETRTWHILEIGKLIDVSAVTRPAYKETTLNTRSSIEAEVSKIKREQLKKDLLLHKVRSK